MVETRDEFVVRLVSTVAGGGLGAIANRKLWPDVGKWMRRIAEEDGR